MSGSISRRLLGGSGLVVFAFLGLAGIALDTAYRKSTEQAALAQLQAHIYTLLATAEEDARGRPRLPQNLPAPRFNRPDSGLYAEVHGSGDSYHWRSASLLARDSATVGRLDIGETRLHRQHELLRLEQGIGWEDLHGNTLPYVFSVAMDTAPLEAEQATFRTTLWSWLGGAALLLLVFQLALVRWGLRPLNRIAENVSEIEQGRRQQVGGPVPRELSPLTDNLNSLIRQGQARQERLRHGLADLAHSLKTPLAVLRGAAYRQDPDQVAHLVDEQVERIDEIIRYHRHRAAVAGDGVLYPPLAVRPVLRRIVDSLQKVHRDRGIRCDLNIGEDMRLRADQGDLFELFGNLLENAYKHCHHQVQVTLHSQAHLLQASIEDDGDGIASRDRQRLLRRGERADQRHPGEGIGLAVASEIVRLYGGTLHIDNSLLGGASLKLVLPAVIPDRTAGTG